jgi:23S rRNA pseudouridine1911/1915/1917 synthase
MNRGGEDGDHFDSRATDDELVSEPVVLRPGREQLGMRLDRYVADHLSDLSRSTVQHLIDDGRVLVDGQVRKPKFRITPGEVVTVDIPAPIPDTIEPDPIPLDVVYEDADVIVVNKPTGLVVHPAPGHPRGTLANALVARVPGINVGGSLRPGIVHRLDKDTSGLIVAAKSDRGRTALVSQWAEGAVEKRYLALVSGVVTDAEATIDAPIGRDVKNRQRMAVARTGRPAVTHLRVLERFANATLLEATLETGRTHQIRVHLAFIGHPVIGDPVYGRKRTGEPAAGRQLLHASELGFRLPDGRHVQFTAPLPEDFSQVLASLRGQDRQSR